MEEKKTIDPGSIKERIIQAARRGDITMRPRWHFVLKGTLVGVGILLALLALLSIASFAVFSLRQTGAWFAPAFGSSGWFAFFRAMPWLLVALSAVFVVLLEVLVRHYSFAYRTSLVLTLAVILVVAVAGGIVAAPFHRGVFKMVRHGPPPPVVGSFYRDIGSQRFSDVHRGVIVGPGSGGSTTLSVRGFLIEDAGGTQWTVRRGPRTRLPFGAEFEPGDTVVVFGPEHAGAIDAFGIRELVGEEP
ncbi:MAG: hypothetical protein Q7S84_03145 [bacterium]|nr:hypothetical protein [bacterium]